MGGFTLPTLGLFAIAYSAAVLFLLASTLRRLYRPRRAAWTAFLLSSVVHGGTVFMADPERWVPLSLFWLVPHLLLLPVLLVSAHRHERNRSAAAQEPPP